MLDLQRALLRLRCTRRIRSGAAPMPFVTNTMSDNHDYEIDYEDVDVKRLMEQVRVRAAMRSIEEPVAAAAPEHLKRLRETVDLDDDRPYELQQALCLQGDWNITPEDLRASHAGPLGWLITTVRLLLRPFVKLAVNLDTPLHKQFKINLGLANAIHELTLENAALRHRLQKLSAHVDDLAKRNDGASTGTHC